ncbi:IS3 family transposase [Solemya velum gill symbiont]|uniref:IS3 family transposase n=1 Tax=Solemya velum gill symbiont TaxID=2340 RepID=UPI000995F306|nr:IS3 family transposase [Solemya velum gill symbiont]
MYSASEKLAIIRLVEESELSIRRTLSEVKVSRSSFYRWYQAYERHGFEGLKNRSRASHQHWNKIPDSVRQQVVDVALEQPELTPRELAWHITDNHNTFVSESSVYRILKAHDLITSPQFMVMSASDAFQSPTRRVHELWQTDFTYFRVVGWGWYFLSTVLDDYSRYIISWRLTTSMAARDVTDTLEDALKAADLKKARVCHKPRLLSDNGPCYISSELREWLKQQQIKHTRGAPYHPMTQGKIERYHRSMKNVVKLENYYFPWELEKAIGDWVQHYNHERYHESLDNVTPADVYYGRRNDILDQRAIIKSRTMTQRKVHNLRKPSRSSSTCSPPGRVKRSRCAPFSGPAVSNSTSMALIPYCPAIAQLGGPLNRSTGGLAVARETEKIPSSRIAVSLAAVGTIYI